MAIDFKGDFLQLHRRDHRSPARAGHLPLDGLDLGDSLLGAIAPDGEVARRAGRILAAFYIPSMPPALLERHGIEPERVASVNELLLPATFNARLTPPRRRSPTGSWSPARPRTG